MQPLDIALVTALVIATTGVWAARGRRPLVAASLIVSIVATLGHVLVAAPRWQFIVVHLAGAGVAFVALAELRGATLRGRRLALSAAVLVVAFGAAAAWSLPVTALSEPSGAFAVGQQRFTIVDPARDEMWGPAPGAARQLGVTVWYPTVDDHQGVAAPWIPAPAAAIDAVAELFRIPGFTLQHLSEITTNAVVDAPISAEGPFPVVLFSHGWSGASMLHTDLLLTLASHGYVVVGIDHTYVSLVTVLDDTIAVLDPTTLDVRDGDDAYNTSAQQLIATFVDDVELVFTELLAIDPLGDAIDVNRVALSGHSTGGGAAIVACARNQWCNAVVGADPWVVPVGDKVIGDGLDVPLLSISSDEWALLPNDARLRRLHAASAAETGRIVIADSAHQDFTLVPDIFRAGQPLGVHGDAPSDTRAITADWTLRFLDHHLRGVGRDPLDLRANDARVTVYGR